MITPENLDELREMVALFQLYVGNFNSANNSG